MEMVTLLGLLVGQLGMWVEAKKDSGCMTVTFKSCLERQWEARENLPNELQTVSLVMEGELYTRSWTHIPGSGPWPSWLVRGLEGKGLED